MHEREEFFNVELKTPFTSISNVRQSTEVFLLSVLSRAVFNQLQTQPGKDKKISRRAVSFQNSS